MADVLSEPEHRVARFLFLAFNLLATVTIGAAVIETVILYQCVYVRNLTGPLQFLVLGAVGWWNVFLTGVCLALAQVVRYLAIIASSRLS